MSAERVSGARLPTGWVDHPQPLDHDTGPGHAERPERLLAIVRRLEESGLAGQVDRRLAEPLATARLALVHDEAYVRSNIARIDAGVRVLDWGDTVVGARSHQAALLSAGAVVGACDRVLAGEWRNAFCAVRPPGHHAERDRAMGFCLYNNVALAAAHLRASGLERVAIVDFDVHHGNGTQHSFEDDPSVFFASLHQFPHYPGTGAARERGRGEGEGATLNLPQAAGTGDAEWLAAFEGVLLPALEDFAPQFVLVSAGFDAHADDPLSDTRLSEAGYARMTRLLVELAERSAHGRLVATLEGGYRLEALAASVEAHVAELVGC